MGGPQLEVFKFGMYIMFPIGIMYYFGTNLDARFSVPDFWPTAEQTHKIPFEKDEIEKELNRLRARRLAARDKRLEMEKAEAVGGQEEASEVKSDVLQAIRQNEANRTEDVKKGGLMGWFR